MKTTTIPSDVILERLLHLHPKIIDLSLGRLERLLTLLGNPERSLPPVVHVAGTNGKGSCIAYLRAMAETAGLSVHVYSSPHLVRFHERIRLAGKLIDETRLSDLLERCEQANGGEPITFFEITTAAAFLAFSEEPADILLLEVGLGGRLDATNVVSHPALSIITPVSLDHMQYLGTTLESIAFEKAGILKPGVPAVIGPQPALAMETIARHAKTIAAPLHAYGSDWKIESHGEGLVFTCNGTEEIVPRPNLYGTHQAENAGVALMAARLLEKQGFEISASTRGLGLVSAEWPARLQHITDGALASLLPHGWELWLDGGHNESAGKALAATLGAWSDKPLHLIYGMLNTKAAGAFLAPLAKSAHNLQAVAIPGEPNSLSAEEAATFAREAGFDATAFPSVPDALRALAKAAANRSEPPGRVLICGSLYLAGRVLALNELPDLST